MLSKKVMQTLSLEKTPNGRTSSFSRPQKSIVFLENIQTQHDKAKKW